MRVGILGGTFDPIHLGHLAAARACIDALNLDQVLVVPAGVPSHRPAASASAEDRWQMVRLACESDSRLTPSRIDIDRVGETYSIHTVTDIAAQYPNAQLFLILGADAYAGFSRWRQPEALRALTTLVVVQRAAAAASTDSGSGAVLHDDVLTVPLAGFDISATDIRARVAAHQSISGLVPEEVSNYIAQHALYL
jgi:nicotinate-nucleotide adenylyltransferase